FSTLRPKPIELNSTPRLCHITPAASGTSPRCFWLSRFSSHPDRPVISAFGSRGEFVMLWSSCRRDRHEDTAPAPPVTITPSEHPRRRGPSPPPPPALGDTPRWSPGCSAPPVWNESANRRAIRAFSRPVANEAASRAGDPDHLTRRVPSPLPARTHSR